MRPDHSGLDGKGYPPTGPNAGPRRFLTPKTKRQIGISFLKKVLKAKKLLYFRKRLKD
jgi:hypothetical protein